MLSTRAGFQVFRRDRVGKTGGGVCIITNPLLRAALVPSNHDSEILSVDIASPSFSYRLILWYRPPRASSDYMTHSVLALRQLCNCSQEVFFVTDANFPNISWEGADARCSGSLESEFLTVCAELRLRQCVIGPTRGKNTLDLLFCRDPASSLASLDIGPPFLTSDHSSLQWTAPLGRLSAPVAAPFRAYKKGRWAQFSSFLSDTDWDYILAISPDATEFCGFLLEILADGVDKFVPLVRRKAKKSSPVPSLQRMRRKRQRLFRQRHTSQAALADFRAFSTKYSQALHKHHSRAEKRLLLSGDRNSLYSHMRQKKSRHASLPPLQSNGVTFTSAQDKAQLFSQHFSSVFIQDDGKYHWLPLFTPRILDEIDFSPARVSLAIKSAKPKLSTGPDGTNTYLIKKLALALAYPLSLLFTLAFATSHFPQQWSLSTTTPLFKGKGSPTKCDNYRGIAKISSLCKIMESIISHQLSHFLESNNILSDSQFGFRPRRSTTGQVLTCLDDWSQSLAAGQSLDVIYIDFQKAFDTCSHPKLLFKLRHHGIAGRLLSWFQVLLTGRQQIVSINGADSTPSPITSGILQGSSSGPLLFTIFINDLACLLEESGVGVKLFADDLKIYSSNSSLLHRSLEIITKWCTDWQMQVAVTKCAVLNIGHGLNTEYKLGGSPIPRAPSNGLRDLGFYITPNLKFTDHCRIYANKARGVSSLVLRSFLSHHPASLIEAFKIYVRPILEYGSPVINSMSKQDANILEHEQKWFTRVVLRRNNLRVPRYAERLKMFGLDPLFKRRWASDLAFCHKIFLDKQYCPVLAFRVLPRPLQHNFRIIDELSATGVRRLFFSNRIASHWNKLPPKHLLCSPNTFKQKLLAN